MFTDMTVPAAVRALANRVLFAIIDRELAPGEPLRGITDGAEPAVVTAALALLAAPGWIVRDADEPRVADAATVDRLVDTDLYEHVKIREGVVRLDLRIESIRFRPSMAALVVLRTLMRAGEWDLTAHELTALVPGFDLTTIDELKRARRSLIRAAPSGTFGLGRRVLTNAERFLNTERAKGRPHWPGTRALAQLPLTPEQLRGLVLDDVLTGALAPGEPARPRLDHDPSALDAALAPLRVAGCIVDGPGGLSLVATAEAIARFVDEGLFAGRLRTADDTLTIRRGDEEGEHELQPGEAGLVRAVARARGRYVDANELAALVDVGPQSISTVVDALNERLGFMLIRRSKDHRFALDVAAFIPRDPAAVVCYGGIELDPARRTSSCRGRVLDLTDLTFDVLHVMLAAGAQGLSLLMVERLVSALRPGVPGASVAGGIRAALLAALGPDIFEVTPTAWRIVAAPPLSFAFASPAAEPVRFLAGAAREAIERLAEADAWRRAELLARTELAIAAPSAGSGGGIAAVRRDAEGAGQLVVTASHVVPADAADVVLRSATAGGVERAQLLATARAPLRRESPRVAGVQLTGGWTARSGSLGLPAGLAPQADVAFAGQRWRLWRVPIPAWGVILWHASPWFTPLLEELDWLRWLNRLDATRPLGADLELSPELRARRLVAVVAATLDLDITTILGDEPTGAPARQLIYRLAWQVDDIDVDVLDELLGRGGPPRFDPEVERTLQTAFPQLLTQPDHITVLEGAPLTASRRSPNERRAWLMREIDATGPGGLLNVHRLAQRLQVTQRTVDTDLHSMAEHVTREGRRWFVRAAPLSAAELAERMLGRVLDRHPSPLEAGEAAEADVLAAAHDLLVAGGWVTRSAAGVAPADRGTLDLLVATTLYERLAIRGDRIELAPLKGGKVSVVTGPDVRALFLHLMYARGRYLSEDELSHRTGLALTTTRRWVAEAVELFRAYELVERIDASRVRVRLGALFETRAEDTIHAGDVALNPVVREAWVDGKPAPLHNGGFDLLVVIACAGERGVESAMLRVSVSPPLSMPEFRRQLTRARRTIGAERLLTRDYRLVGAVKRARPPAPAFLISATDRPVPAVSTAGVIRQSWDTAWLRSELLNAVLTGTVPAGSPLPMLEPYPPELIAPVLEGLRAEGLLVADTHGGLRVAPEEEVRRVVQHSLYNDRLVLDGRVLRIWPVGAPEPLELPLRPRRHVPFLHAVMCRRGRFMTGVELGRAVGLTGTRVKKVVPELNRSLGLELITHRPRRGYALDLTVFLPPDPATIIEYAGVTVDWTLRRATQHGRPLTLRNLAFDCLCEIVAAGPDGVRPGRLKPVLTAPGKTRPHTKRTEIVAELREQLGTRSLRTRPALQLITLDDPRREAPR